MFALQRSVRVLDGAVILFDGVAGVEAQSETVWQQAKRYSLARIGFVNKMDREGASYEETCKAISSKLQAIPLPVHFPREFTEQASITPNFTQFGLSRAYLPCYELPPASAALQLGRRQTSLELSI